MSKREIRTWRGGEVGVYGTRRVQPDGSVVIGGSRGSKAFRRVYRCDAFKPYIGRVIFFHDGDDTRGVVHFYVADWLPSGRVYGGRLIAIVREALCASKGPRGHRCKLPVDHGGVHSDDGVAWQQIDGQQVAWKADRQ